MAGAMPAIGEVISLVAVGTSLAAGAVVVGTTCIGGTMYYLIQESAHNPLLRQVLSDDGDSDYDKILDMEEKRQKAACLLGLP